MSDPITPDDLTELRRIVARLGDQDNLCTADVMFCVQKPVRITGIDPEYIDDGSFIWLAGGDELDDDAATLAEAAYDNGDDWFTTAEGDHWNLSELDRVGFRMDWETVQFFFTSEGAHRYLDANRHRLSKDGDPRVYGESFHRNREMIAVLRSLPALLVAVDRVAHLEKFKALAHQILDDAGVPKDPKPGECRISARLAALIEQRDNAQAVQS